MDTEEGSTSQVRRTARARKVNPKFFGDESEYGSYKQLVDRITASDFSGNNKDNENSKQQEENRNISESQGKADSDIPAEGNVDPDNLKPAEVFSAFSKPLSKHSDTSGGINIALKTVSVKIPKKSKSNIPENLKLVSGKIAPSVIVRCRSSTESEDSVENESEKRKLDSQGLGNDSKKLKSSQDQNYNCIERDKPLNANMKVPTFTSCSQLFKKSYVPLPIVGNLDKNRPKYVVTSDAKLNFPGKRLKIVSLKPITTIKKDDIHLDSKSINSSESVGSKLILGEGGPVELKIVKKQIYPLSGSSLPPVLPKENLNETNKSSNKVEKITEIAPSTKLFSSDGEDDIPLNKFIKQDVVKDVVKKKKKSVQKDKTQKGTVKTKVKNKKLAKKKSNDVNDQDDIPLKAFIKKSKSLSKGLSSKVMNAVSKKKVVETSIQSNQENIFQINEPPSKKKKADSDSSQKPKVPFKLKISNIKSGTSVKSQKVKPLVIKKKKMNSVKGGKVEKFKNVLGASDKAIKKLNRAKAIKLLSNENSSVSIKKRENRPQKLRFKFPKKINKVASKDSPLSNETTNIVISVSGIEGDYACVAIDKDHISVPCDADEDNNVEPRSLKKKKKFKSNIASPSKKYTVDSGLVLEADISSSIDIPRTSETKTKFVPTEKDSVKMQSPSKKESSKKESSAKKNARKELASIKKKLNLLDKKEYLSAKKVITGNKESPSVKREFACFKDESDSVLEDSDGESSHKKEYTPLNVGSSDAKVECSYEDEQLIDKGNSTVNKIDSLCDNEDLDRDKKDKPFIDNVKPATEDAKTTVVKIKSSSNGTECSTDKAKALLCKEESLFGINNLESAIYKVDSVSYATKSSLDSGEFPSNKTKSPHGKTKTTNCQELFQKQLVSKSDEVESQSRHLEKVNNVDFSEKPERNFITETNENIGGNKNNYHFGEQKSSRETKYTKPRNKEINEKESKKESIHKLEGKKDKEKDKKKEEKGITDLKSDTFRKFDVDSDTDKKIVIESDHQKQKIQKSDNKKEKEKSSGHFRSLNEIKNEERHIKKEKHDSKELVNKTYKDSKSKEKIEKAQKEFHVLKKSEKSYHSFSKVEKDNSKSSSVTALKQKDASKIPDIKETKVEKDSQVKDASSPITKPKKRENFEEALLNIPLPKLSKNKKDKDDKLKKTPSKDKKYEAKEIKQEIHLLKHKESESSKSLVVKTDKPHVKSESNSKVIKTEKGYRKEERRHSSSSSSDKSEKRKSEYDSKDNIKFYEISHDGDKSKKDEKERSKHSHKKHKREHSDSHRSRSSSSEGKKHRSSDEKYERKYNKERVVVKKEDSKDVIIKKMVDGKESSSLCGIKTELNSSTDHSNEKIANESFNVNLLDISPTKMELKSEIIIDEEHLVSKKGNFKEEDTENKSCDLDGDSISSVSGICLKKEPYSSECKEKETDFTTEEKKQKEERPSAYGDVLSKEVNENHEVNIAKNYCQTLIAETKFSSNNSTSDVTESDIGILDELRNLKQTFEKPQNDKEMESSGKSITISETNTKVTTPASSDSEIKLDSPLHLQTEGKKSDEKSTSLEPPTKEVIKPELLDSASLDHLDMMESSVSLPPKLETDVKKSDHSLDSVDDFETAPQLSSELNKSDFQMEEEEISSNYANNSNISDNKDARLVTSTFKNDEPKDSQYVSNIPISSIPLPNETIKKPTTESEKFDAPLILDENSELSKEVPPLLSDADEGFVSEVSSHTRENFLSDEETPLTSDLSDNESLPAAITPPATLQPPKELTPEEKEEMERKNREVVEERMKSFEYLEENLYLSERVKNKRSKEVRRMVCDCTLTKEEISNGEMGCGDDCLNRLLMIECGTRCPLKDHCMNKKFQQKDYSQVEVFNAIEKGCGVRSCEDIKQGTFIMEYIGEVFDTKEFKRRRKEYAKSGSPHFYFMALRPDRLIDATRKGGISRFINHSCSPNAETQKWTINGDIRIGFFASKNIPAGEEITFDYKLERYGREPQRCFCGTPECRGWLGEPPDKKTKEEKEEDRRKELKDKQKREAKRFLFEDMDLEDEIERLTVRGLRNRQDTLDLSRLMVRCEDSASRLTLLKILESGEEASKRLFLDYHGLKLLWSWMVDISSSLKCIPLKLEIIKSLKSLPITNKTQVSDSRVICIVERWSKMDSNTDRKELQVEGATKKLGDGSDSDTEAGDMKEPSPVETPSPPDDSSQDSNEVVDVPAVVNKIVGEPAVNKESEVSNIIDVEEESKYSESEVAELAKQLLSVWSELKEAFKIPRKKRIEMMKEHEKEVDDEYAKYLDKKTESTEERTHSYYISWRCTSTDRDKQKDYRDRFDRDRRRDRRWSKWRDSFDEEDKGLSKEERRERFAKQVAKEEEEARQRKLQEEMWNLHLERCNLLGHDPYYTPIFDPSGQYYWDPEVGNWQAYVGPSGNLPVPASYGMNRTDVGIENICPNVPSNKLFGSGSFYPLPHTPVSEGEEKPLRMSEDQSNNILDLASIPLPGEAPLIRSLSPNENSPLNSIPPPGEEIVETLNGIETPPMAPPGPVTIKLPPKWKIARDSDRRIYFYHTKTRHTLWEMPTEDLHEKLMNRYGLNSDSESDIESDSDSSSSSDSEDFSSDEDDNDDDEPEVDPVKKIENELNEKMIRRPKGKKVRSEKLVQERVISPILFQDREAARRERKEAKEKARVEARKERYGMLKKSLIAGENTRPVGNILSSKSDGDKEGKLNLPEENVASPNDNDEDDNLEEQLIKFSRKQKSESKSSSKAKSKERAATALADTSDIARKIKDNFRSRMATYIVSVLNPYRKADCKEGRITSNEDFKYLARKLTHFVMVKELKQLPSIDGLECSDSVKHKTKEFVRKYMSKYGSIFKRDPNDTKEY